MAKIFFLVFVGLLSVSMTFAEETQTCLPRGSECIGSSLTCCKPTTCMFFANRCVGDGLIVPDEPKQPEVEKPQPENCLAQGSKCVGENLQCCKSTTCMFYANRCVGI